MGIRLDKAGGRKGGRDLLGNCPPLPKEINARPLKKGPVREQNGKRKGDGDEEDDGKEKRKNEG